MEIYNNKRTNSLRGYTSSNQSKGNTNSRINNNINTEIVTTTNVNDHRTIISQTYRDVTINAEQYISSTPNSLFTNCKQYMANNEVRQLIQEISSNLQHSINATALYNTIDQKKEDDRHTFMQQHGLELSDSEFIAIILWSSSEILTKKYHIDCENNNQENWQLFINALTNAIKKLSQAVIINEFVNDSDIFSSIPSTLYRGTTYFNPNGSKWNLDTILSFTAALTVAETFAARSVDEEHGGSFILSIKNFPKYLINGELIAAPINWLSSYDYEDEWMVLPSITFKIKKDDTTTIAGCDTYLLSAI